jgi:hypothetical protein
VPSESASSGIDSDEVSGPESIEGSEEGTPRKVCSTVSSGAFYV